MLNNKFMPLLLSITFVLALLVSAIYLKPEPVKVDLDSRKMRSEPRESQPRLEIDEKIELIEPELVEEEIAEAKIISALSQNLQEVKDGKKSILSVIFSSGDLNQQLQDLLDMSDSGEAWADYAIGQLNEMCSYLYQTPEPELIKMFSGASLRASPEQQAQMSELLPVIVNASQRCKTLDADRLKSLGDSRDWFDKAAEANDPNAFVISGYSLLSERIMSESAEYANAVDESRVEIGKRLRDQAKQEFRDQMHQFIVDGKTNPETVISMAEHLNLFYEKDHPYKSKEAWMLLACQQGYENNCSSSSTAMSVFCMFDPSCQTGGDFQQGVLWAQGQYKLDEYQRIADELKLIFDTQDWEKLGF